MRRLFLQTFVLMLDLATLFFRRRRRRHHYLTAAHKPVHYVKDRSDVPEGPIDNVTFFTRLLLIIMAIGLVGFIALQNLTPLGVQASYDINDDEENISELTPKDRVNEVTIDGRTMYKQIDDLVYFNTQMPFHFDKATVRMVIQNPYPDQEVKLGFKNKYEWGYETQYIDLPLLKYLRWKTIGEQPTLYQREETYTSLDEFFKNPPKDKVIGVYKFDTSTLPQFQAQIPDYKSATVQTVIDTPLRGKHTMYVYLSNERFIMNIEKQDLNWYDGEDVMTVRVFKEGDEVYTVSADDDGITDRSNKTLAPQTVKIENPGPELPESGVYKVVIDAPGDVVIKKITTNLHKIVFEGAIFPVSNSEVYNDISRETKPVTLYTDAQLLSATTYHEQGLQNISVDGEEIQLREVQYDELLTPRSDFSEVTLPKTDVILNGTMGYFAFTREQFFRPNPFLTMNITTEEDLDLVDYILTDYTPGRKVGEWQIVEREFDLTSAVIQDGTLSWVIQSPGLKENGRDIIIRDIQVEMTKQPWLKI